MFGIQGNSENCLYGQIAALRGVSPDIYEDSAAVAQSGMSTALRFILHRQLIKVSLTRNGIILGHSFDRPVGYLVTQASSFSFFRMAASASPYVLLGMRRFGFIALWKNPAEYAQFIF